MKCEWCGEEIKAVKIVVSRDYIKILPENADVKRIAGLLWGAPARDGSSQYPPKSEVLPDAIDWCEHNKVNWRVVNV